MQAPLATALASSTAREAEQIDGVDGSGALFSSSGERESGEEGFVDENGYLVERADYAHASHAPASEAGPRIVKEIIIYDVYENDDNGCITNPNAPNGGEGPNNNQVEYDSDNYLEEFNVADHVGDVEGGAENIVTNDVGATMNGVEINSEINVTNEVGATKNGAKMNSEINETKEVDATKNGVEINSSEINEQSSVGPAKNGTPLTETVKNVVDEIVDNDPKIDKNVAEEVGEEMETAVSEVPPSLPNPAVEIQTKYEGRSLSRKAKSIASAVRVFRHVSQPSSRLN